MMNIFEFISDSPFVSFFIACVISGVIQFAIKALVVIPIRALLIRRHGWPPKHCDADGDFKKED